MKLAAILLGTAALMFVCTPAMAFLDTDPTAVKFSTTGDDGFSLAVTSEYTLNRGTAGTVRCKDSQEMFISKYDLSSAAGWTVTDAEMYVTSASPGSLLYAADLSTICVPWTEGTQANAAAAVGDPCWSYRHYPANVSSPAATDWWTVPNSNFAYASYGNNGSLACYAEPDGTHFTTFTKSTVGGTATVYRIKVDPDLVHSLIIGDQYGLTLSDTRGYALQNNTVYARDQWGGSAGPYLLVKGGITDTTPPGAVSGFAAAAGNWNGQVLLSWVAPTDSGPKGKAFGYNVRYSTSAITPANFASATQVDRWRIPRPQAAGTTQRMLLENLTPGTTYYFAMLAYDQANNKTAVVTTSLALPPSQSVTPLANGNFTVPAAAASIPGAQGKLQYWACSEYTKVNPVTGNRYADGYTSSGSDDYKKGNPVWDAANNKVILTAARNEVTGFQLILQELVSLTNVSVAVSDLTNTAIAPPGGHPPVAITASPNIEKLLSFYVPSGSTYYPDACIPLASPFNTTFSIPNTTNNIISGQTNQSVWVDIYVPKQMPAGVYTGTITVSAAQLSPAVTVNVQLTVRNWQVPDQVSFVVDLNGYHTPWAFGTVAATKLSYFQLAHKHRQNVNTVPNSHSLNADFSGNIDPDRVPTLTGDGATLAVSSWSTFDSNWGPYLDGSAFTAALGYTGPGAGMPVPECYTSFFDSWPLSSYFWYDRNNVNGVGYWYTLWPGNNGGAGYPSNYASAAPAPNVAYPPEYETGVKNIIKAWAEHAQAKGWTRTYFQHYLNNKYYYGTAARPHSQFWDLDEPSEGESMLAVGYYQNLFRQGAALANAPDVKWHYRVDISDKTGFSRGQLDGRVNLWDCSFVDYYHMFMPQRQLAWPDEQWWYYGGGTDPTGGELANTKRFLQVWCWGVDGALPYWDSYETSWTSAQALSVVYAGQGIPGYSTYNGAIASVRMKQMRRGQQDIEYLAYLGGQPGWNRPAVARALAQRYADTGGDSYNGLNELKFFQLREDLAASIPVLLGDVTGDGHVDVIDLLTLVAAFGSYYGDVNYDPSCDFNSDGAVDVIDLLYMIENFGM